MTKRREAAVAFLVGLMLTLAADFSARALAQVQAHARPHLSSAPAPAELLRFVPAILVAGACLHAVAFHSRRALYFVLCCTLPAYAFWSYLGDLGFHHAIAAERWTAAALSSGFAWLASTVVVMLGISPIVLSRLLAGEALGAANDGFDYDPSESKRLPSRAFGRSRLELRVSGVSRDSQFWRVALQLL